MKVFLTTIGERTTELCKKELMRQGLEVIVLDGLKTWNEKYLEFLNVALETKEDCFRIDADIIPNRKLFDFLLAIRQEKTEILMAQAKTYDFYQNDLTNSICFYSKDAIKFILASWKDLDPLRPETSAWRLRTINPKTKTFNIVCGMHGFFQDVETQDRAKRNKIARKQLLDYRFDLVEEINNLCEKF